MPVGVCLECARTMPIKSRGLCFRCYEHPDIRHRHPVVRRTSYWDGKTLLPQVDRYPDLTAPTPCACGLAVDGECPACERVERAVFQEPSFDERIEQ